MIANDPNAGIGNPFRLRTSLPPTCLLPQGLGVRLFIGWEYLNATLCLPGQYLLQLLGIDLFRVTGAKDKISAIYLSGRSPHGETETENPDH